MALRVPGQPSPAAVTPSLGLLPHAAGAGVVPATGTAGNPGVVSPLPTADLVRAVAHEVAAVQRIAEHATLANQAADVPNFANAVTGIYGISGSGKTSLAVTAIEFGWENFGAISLVYAMDLGGFGNKLLSLVRLGIARVWDPRNHVNSFETMELISLGGWPETIDDPETGKADPKVRIILPRRIVTTLSCPQRHAVARFDLANVHDAAAFDVASIPCPTCGVVTGTLNGLTSAQIMRHKLFRNVGHRVFDSMTEMCDWGSLRLTKMSADGLLPTGKEGGSLLGSADALREGSIVYGSGSMAQVGFMQNRSYQWIANIRSIPDQIMPATCTFAVEQGKADDDSGGVPILGPQIAGNARTAKVPRWVGNCLHASREPDIVGNMRYRLWLTSHLDSRDPRRIPYLAKHRGIPFEMPEFLEDPWDDDKAKRDALAWSQCSLKVFYTKLVDQLVKLEAADRLRYPNAPALQAASAGEDDVMGDVTAPTMLAPAGVHVAVAGGQTMSARRGLRVPGATVAPSPGPPPVAIVTHTIAAPPVAQVAPVAQATPAPGGGIPAGLVVAPIASSAGTADPSAIPPTATPVDHPVALEATSVLQKQLEASLAARTAAQAETAAAPAQPALAASTAAAAPSTASTPAVSSPSRLRQPGALRVPGTTVAPITPAIVAQVEQTGPTLAHPNGPAAPLPTTAMPAPAPPPRLPARRTPRPPVS